MNREIKFRAWDGKKMWPSESFEYGVATNGSILSCHNIGGDFNAIDEDIELMQYTGLKDKNGTEIYEGDVIKWGDHCDWCHEVPVRVAEVKFAPDIQFHSQVGVFFYGNFAYRDTDKHIEVIGNIYENPELLKEDK